jgi:hypothetical protein
MEAWKIEENDLKENGMEMVAVEYVCHCGLCWRGGLEE